MLALAIAATALAAAPTASATTGFTWSGGDKGGLLTAGDWSNADNWSGGTIPSGSVGALAFPDLPNCDGGENLAPPGTCYLGDDDLGALSVDQLVFDDDRGSLLRQDDAGDTITLDGEGNPAVGLVASPSEADSGSGNPLVLVPIALGADQIWDVDGGSTDGSGADFGAFVEQVTGIDTLGLSFTDGGTLETTRLGTGAVTATGDGRLVAQELSGITATLPAAGSTLENGASLDVRSPGTTSGPLTVTGGNDSDRPTVEVAQGYAPETTLAVDGNVTLDQWVNLDLDLVNNGTAAGTDFSQLTTSGDISFAGATLNLSQGAETGDSITDCADLAPGDAFPIITATGSLSGDLTYLDTSGNLDTLTPGSTSAPISVAIPDGVCPIGTQSAIATVTYGTNAITARIVAQPAPTNTSAPVISGIAQVGEMLTSNSGGWTGSPTLRYRWQRCADPGATSCTDIAGAPGSAYTATSADVGEYLRVAVTATNAGGSLVAYSAVTGPVTAVPAPPIVTTSGPTAQEIESALGEVTRPSGKRAITALLRGGSFKTSFHAPSAGSLSVVWKTTVTNGAGKHGKRRQRKPVTVATGTVLANGAATLQLTVLLTRAGRTLLKEKPTDLSITAVEQFQPSGGVWIQVAKRFSL